MGTSIQHSPNTHHSPEVFLFCVFCFDFRPPQKQNQATELPSIHPSWTLRTIEVTGPCACDASPIMSFIRGDTGPNDAKQFNSNATEAPGPGLLHQSHRIEHPQPEPHTRSLLLCSRPVAKDASKMRAPDPSLRLEERSSSRSRRRRRRSGFASSLKHSKSFDVSLKLILSARGPGSAGTEARRSIRSRISLRPIGSPSRIQFPTFAPPVRIPVCRRATTNYRSCVDRRGFSWVIVEPSSSVDLRRRTLCSWTGKPGAEESFRVAERKQTTNQ